MEKQNDYRNNSNKSNMQQYRARQEKTEGMGLKELKANKEVKVQRENKENKESRDYRDNTYNRGYQRNNWLRNNTSMQNASQARPASTREEETIDDIRDDISRIQKEIDLEIKEIKSMRLGM